MVMIYGISETEFMIYDFSYKKNFVFFLFVIFYVFFFLFSRDNVSFYIKTQNGLLYG